MSRIVGKTFISELRIARMDQIEKKNDATDVGRASRLTVNGMTNTNVVATIRMTIAIIRTNGFRRISKFMWMCPNDFLVACPTNCILTATVFIVAKQNTDGSKT
jgi:hypothetical protein